MPSARFGLLLVVVLAACAGDPARRLSTLAAERPVPYTRELFERVHAAGALPDVAGVMDRKAHALIDVIRLADTELTDYRPAGPMAPSKAFIRELALGYLVHSNTFLNVEEVRTLFVDLVRDERTSSREQLLLAPLVRYVGPLVRRPTIEAWITWIPTQLARPYDPVTYELVLARLHALGLLAPAYGLREQARAMYTSVVATRGEVPLAANVSGAAIDLERAALAGAYDLDVDARMYSIDPLPRAGTPFELWREIRDAATPPPGAPDQAFDALAAPLFAQPIQYDKDTAERIRDAFALRGVAVEHRTRLLRRLLALRATDVTPFDATSLDGFTVAPEPNVLVTLAAMALANEPALVDTDLGLARVVADLAIRPFDRTGYTANDEAFAVLQPVIARVLRNASTVARADRAIDRATGTAILAAWPAMIRELAARQDSHVYFATYTCIGQMLTLAELAPVYGQVAEVRVLLDEMAASRPATHELRYMHAVLLRGATIARRALAASPAR